MPNLRRFASTVLCLGAATFSSAALAQEAPPAPSSGQAPAAPPPDLPPVTPPPVGAAPPSAAPPAPPPGLLPYKPPTSVAPYAPSAPPTGGAHRAPQPAGAATYAPASERPPEGPGRYEKGGGGGGSRWYGWQILIPTLVSDAMVFGGAFSGSDAGLKVALAGLIGHGISGPIVHFAHGQPLRALGSLLLEAGLPGLVLGSALGSTCRDECIGPAVALVVGVPVALTLGASIDSAALAWEPSSPARDEARNLTVRVAPLVLPPLRMGSNRLPAPAGAALTGTF